MSITAAPAVFRPAGSIDEVVERLDRVVARARAEDDRAGFFACLYRGVTVRVRQGIADGRFQDGARMERLDVLFANRYLAAVEAQRDGRRPTRSWEVAFHGARRGRLLILQHLLLGINAHINLDLGVAAAETSPGRELQGLKHDFDEISRLLGEMLDDVQSRIGRVSPWMRALDWVGARNDEVVCTFCLGASRDLAWRSAQRLASMERGRVAEEIERMDRVVAALALPITTPAFFLRPVLLAIRLREPARAAEVIDALGDAA